MYAGIIEIFARYWKAYGGYRALLGSPYLHISLILLVITAHYWLNNTWWDQPISILPNLVGFALGGLAMFLSFGDEKFQSMLAEDGVGEKASTYLEISATLVHFIIMQLAALLFALARKSLDFSYNWPVGYQFIVDMLTYIFSGFGYLLFLYSICSMIAATMSVFRMTSWYEMHTKVKRP